MSAIRVRRSAVIGAVIAVLLVAVATIVCLTVFASPANNTDSLGSSTSNGQATVDDSAGEQSTTPMGITLSDGSVYGNVPGNVARGGWVNSWDGWIYYDSMSEDILDSYRMREDGAEKQLLDEGSASYVSMYDGWVYYLDQGKNIFRMRPDGGRKEQVSQFFANYLNIVDGWFYFVKSESYRDYVTNDVWKMRPDGSEATMLWEGGADHVVTYDEWVYFRSRTVVEGMSRWTLCRVGVDGSGFQELVPDLGSFVPAGDWLFYRRVTDNSLWKTRLDGSESQKVSDSNASGLNAWGDWVYYLAYENDYSQPLYRVNIETSEVSLVAAGNCMDAFVVGEQLLIKMFPEGSNSTLPFDCDRRFLSNSDGSNARLVEERAE